MPSKRDLPIIDVVNCNSWNKEHCTYLPHLNTPFALGGRNKRIDSLETAKLPFVTNKYLTQKPVETKPVANTFVKAKHLPQEISRIIVEEYNRNFSEDHISLPPVKSKTASKKVALNQKRKRNVEKDFHREWRINEARIRHKQKIRESRIIYTEGLSSSSKKPLPTVKFDPQRILQINMPDNLKFVREKSKLRVDVAHSKLTSEVHKGTETLPTKKVSVTLPKLAKEPIQQGIKEESCSSHIEHDQQQVNGDHTHGAGQSQGQPHTHTDQYIMQRISNASPSAFVPLNTPATTYHGFSRETTRILNPDGLQTKQEKVHEHIDLAQQKQMEFELHKRQRNPTMAPCPSPSKLPNGRKLIPLGPRQVSNIQLRQVSIGDTLSPSHMHKEKRRLRSMYPMYDWIVQQKEIVHRANFRSEKRLLKHKGGNRTNNTINKIDRSQSKDKINKMSVFRMPSAVIRDNEQVRSFGRTRDILEKEPTLTEIRPRYHFKSYDKDFMDYFDDFLYPPPPTAVHGKYDDYFLGDKLPLINPHDNDLMPVTIPCKPNPRNATCSSKSSIVTDAPNIETDNKVDKPEKETANTTKIAEIKHGASPSKVVGIVTFGNNTPQDSNATGRVNSGSHPAQVAIKTLTLQSGSAKSTRNQQDQTTGSCNNGSDQDSTSKVQIEHNIVHAGAQTAMKNLVFISPAQ